MGVWIIDAEPTEPDLFFYVEYDTGIVSDFDFYIQGEPDDSDEFYIQYDTGISIDDAWYIQNEPTEIEGDQFYIEGDPGPDDQFYIQDYEEPDLFYFIELFTVGEELQFYIVNDENYEESGFVIVSDFDPGRHDWRSELTDSGEHFIEVSEAIEDMMIDLENLQLTPGEIQTDQDSWVITFEDY